MRPNMTRALMSLVPAIAVLAMTATTSMLMGPALAQTGVGGGAPPPTEREVRRDTVFVPGEATVIQSERSDGQVVREEHILLRSPVDDPLVLFTLTNAGATIRSAVLQNEQYQREALPPLEGVPPEKIGDGPIDVVTTWAPRFLPFRVVFRELSVADPVTRVVRIATGGVVKEGRLVAPIQSERIKFSVDRPVVEGDRLIVSAPASIAGEYRVAGVRYGGAIIPDPSFRVGDEAEVEGVAYEVRRQGAFDILYEDDPVFTRVSERPGLPAVYVWPDPVHDTSSVFLEVRLDPGDHPYELRLAATLHNFGDKEIRTQPGLRVSGWQHPGVSGGSLFARPTNILAASCRTDDSLKRVEWPSLRDDAMDAIRAERGDEAIRAYITPTDWVSVDTTYFALAAVPVRQVAAGQCQLSATIFDPNVLGAWTIASTYYEGATLQLPGTSGGCVPTWLAAARPDARTCADAHRALGLSPEATREEVNSAWSRLRMEGRNITEIDEAKDSVMNRRRLAYQFRLYTGPKDVEFLNQSHPTLRDSLDLGIFGFISKPLHTLLVWIEGGVGSWALAIILLTIMIKVALLPLTNKSYKSMQRMQKLKPKLDELKKKHGGDRQRFAQEQMALFKREGVNPLGGCLPMLLQMPVWFGLYQMIYASVELYRAPMGLWIDDLSAPDPYYILPVLLGGLMFVQTFLTTSTATLDGVQGKILKFGMPIMFAVFMLFLPSALVLYIFANVALTIVQNLIIRRRMGMT